MAGRGPNRNIQPGTFEECRVIPTGRRTARGTGVDGFRTRGARQRDPGAGAVGPGLRSGRPEDPHRWPQRAGVPGRTRSYRPDDDPGGADETHLRRADGARCPPGEGHLRALRTGRCRRTRHRAGIGHGCQPHHRTGAVERQLVSAHPESRPGDANRDLLFERLIDIGRSQTVVTATVNGADSHPARSQIAVPNTNRAELSDPGKGDG